MAIKLSKYLYRINEVSEILSCSKYKIYELLINGELTAHNNTPGYRGTRVTGESIEQYYQRYKIANTDWQE